MPDGQPVGDIMLILTVQVCRLKKITLKQGTFVQKNKPVTFFNVLFKMHLQNCTF